METGKTRTGIATVQGSKFPGNVPLQSVSDYRANENVYVFCYSFAGKKKLDGRRRVPTWDFYRAVACQIICQLLSTLTLPTRFVLLSLFKNAEKKTLIT